MHDLRVREQPHDDVDVMVVGGSLVAPARPVEALRVPTKNDAEHRAESRRPLDDLPDGPPTVEAEVAEPIAAGSGDEPPEGAPVGGVLEAPEVQPVAVSREKKAGLLEEWRCEDGCGA